jgi:hypothetical protein
MRSQPKKLDVLHATLGTKTGLTATSATCVAIIVLSPFWIAMSVVVLFTGAVVYQSERRRG